MLAFIGQLLGILAVILGLLLPGQAGEQGLDRADHFQRACSRYKCFDLGRLVYGCCYGCTCCRHSEPCFTESTNNQNVHVCEIAAVPCV